jgi:quercetin dioxygenase-like cupin family protein
MNTFTRHRLGVLAVIGLGASLGPAVATASTPPTEPPTPPIGVEEFTRIDPETAVRGSVADAVTIDIAGATRVAVARFTVQPGAQFPWHSHQGPVLVTVTAGELIYVMADDCSEHSYPAGTAFIDPGRGHVHSAYNPTDAETVIVATFTDAPEDGPLSITEGVTAPADNCGLPTTAPS